MLVLMKIPSMPFNSLFSLEFLTREKPVWLGRTIEVYNAYSQVLLSHIPRVITCSFIALGLISGLVLYRKINFIIAEKEADIVKKEKEITEKNELLAKQKAEITEKNELLAKQKIEIAEKVGFIAKLRGAVKKIKDKILSERKIIENQEANLKQIEALEKQIDDKIKQIDDKNQVVKPDDDGA